MIKRKKALSLILSGIVCSSLILTGCGNSKEEESKETVNLTWYVIGDEPADNDIVEEEVNKYLKDKINATVDIKHIPFGDYTKKMSVISNSGEPYDLAFTCSWAFPYLEYARKGAFLELAEIAVIAPVVELLVIYGGIIDEVTTSLPKDFPHIFSAYGCPSAFHTNLFTSGFISVTAAS